MHETFDHTADLGLRATATDLPTLFAEVAHALFAVIVENPGAIVPAQEWLFYGAGDHREYLLFDWLRELLYRFDAEHRLYRTFDVQVRDDGLSATISGERLEPERHELSHEVKAITYHGLRVEPTADGWLAELIVDI